jgi:hypothetical protein
LTLALGAAAQHTVSNQVASETTIRPVPKDQIPLYSVVWGFFTLMGHFKESAPFIYEKRLIQMGIEPGSAAAEAVDAAVKRGHEVVQRPTTDSDFSGSAEEFEALESKRTRERVRDLAMVYGALLADLEAAGTDPDVVRDYLETTIRPSSSVSVEVAAGADPVGVMQASPVSEALQSFEAEAAAAFQRGETNMIKEERP